MTFARSGVLAALIAAASAMPALAHAADGTITFTGQVTAQTCTINGGAGKDFTVALPPVSASSLSIDGATAGRTPFKIVLTACTSATGNVSAYFEAGTTIDTATGRLKNAAGTATKVQIGLLNSDLTNTAIVLGAAQAAQNSQSVAIASNTATLNYFAQYVASGGAAGVGTVSTSVMYTMSYQ
ncbi:type 1 fimbrial protein [Janthinobacterium sp. FW305-129]|uniref:fimbrial protein n=1 Tax=Janthinobacterium sp. FW305-129 TaxID=2775054 RepID=UPI001E6126CE|nr:fimbrial protein [Janthinobacterium sp. FW305-129]MCC7597903.1 type 1 fimbrial protein [Janthinobacterium sp. FW305-129]